MRRRRRWGGRIAVPREGAGRCGGAEGPRARLALGPGPPRELTRRGLCGTKPGSISGDGRYEREIYESSSLSQKLRCQSK